MKSKIIAFAGFTGSGKTVAAQYLKKNGYDVIDVDVFVHALYRKGKPLWKKIKGEYGRGVLLENGEIWRQKLAEIIYSDKKAYNKFIKIVYPAMNRALLADIKKRRGTVILDMAVLFESGFYKYADAIIYFKTSERIWKKRIGGIKWKNYEGIRKYQTMFPVSKKIALSDYILYNNKSIKDLCGRAGRLVKKIEEGFNGRQAATGRKNT